MVSRLHTKGTVRAATVSAPGRLPRSAALDGICVVRTSVQADGLDGQPGRLLLQGPCRRGPWLPRLQVRGPRVLADDLLLRHLGHADPPGRALARTVLSPPPARRRGAGPAPRWRAVRPARPRTATSTALKAIMVGSLRATIAVTRTGRLAASSTPSAGQPCYWGTADPCLPPVATVLPVRTPARRRPGGVLVPPWTAPASPRRRR
jgi:hypothetical protein